MKRACIAVALLAAFAAAACVNAPTVVQGTVTGYDANAKTVRILDERTKQEMIFSVDKAEIGAAPQEGDLVRIAYREQAGKNAATRVMNLTRQKEVAKGAH